MASYLRVSRDEPRANATRLFNLIADLSLSDTEATSFQDVLVGTNRIENLVENHLLLMPTDGKSAKSVPRPPDILYMFKSGCRQESSTQMPNCAEACANNRYMFQSLSTLANCLTLSSASLLMGDGTIPRNSIDLSPLKSVGITHAPDIGLDINGTAILSSIVRCATASCQESSFGNCAQGIINLANSSHFGSESITSIREAFKTYCDSVDISVNADIAGPGVLVSLVLQGVIVMAASGLIYMLNLWVSHLGLVFGPKRSWAASKHWQSALRLSTPNAAIVSAAMEFQEAQAYFTMAIQVATLATFPTLCGHSCAAGLDSVSSVSESIMNMELVRALAVNSVLPVVLMQSVLQRIGMKWSYNLVLTFGTLILALVVDHQRTAAVANESLWRQLRVDGDIAECGGNPTLMAFCFAAAKKFGFRSFLVLRLAYPTIIVLTFDQIFSMLFFSRVSLWVADLPFVTDKMCRLTRLVARIAWGGLEAILLINTAVHIDVLRRIAEGIGMSSSQWSYGQVVSAMIWAPVFGKLIYYNIFGVKQGFEARLLREYRCSNHTQDELKTSNS